MASKRVSLKGKGAELFFGDITDPAMAVPSFIPLPPADSANHAEASMPSELPPDVPTPVKKRARRPALDNRAAIDVANTAELSTQTPHPEPTPADDQETIAAITTIIKHPGREVSFVRLSPEEKARLADIVYSYKRQGMKVTETELHRIALNYLFVDYDKRGKASLLARLLVSMKA